MTNNSVNTMAVRWERREPPLPIVGMIGQGAVARSLARTIVCRDEKDTAPLRASVGDDWLMVLGPDESLPWVDGITYLGWEANLLLPTVLQPSPSSFLLARAIDIHMRTDELPVVAVLPGRIFLSEAATRSARRQLLADFAEHGTT